MSDERQQRIIDLLYDELDPRQSRDVRQAMDEDEALAAEFAAFAEVRNLYQQVELPTPPEALTEAILRQEAILRPQPQSWWSALFQWAMQPAVGITTVVVVAIGLGVVGNVTFLGKQAQPMQAVGANETEAEASAQVREAPSRLPITETVPAAAEHSPPSTTIVAKSETRSESSAAKAEPRPQTSAPPAERARRRPAMIVDELQAGDSNADKSKRQGAADAVQQPAKGWAFNTGADDDQAHAAPAQPLELAREVEKKKSQREVSGARFGEGFGSGGNVATGSAGQLTEPGLFDDAYREESAAAESALKDSRAEEEDRSTSLAGMVAADEKQPAPAPKTDRLAVSPSPAPPAAPANKAGASRSQVLDKESFELGQKQHSDRLQASFAAGMRAFNYANYSEALSYFQRTYELDGSRQLAPMPQIMQARTLVQLKRYGLAARFYEQVLNEYPKYPQRVALVRELIACQQMRKDNDAVAQVRKRYAREASLIDRADEANGASPEPGTATQQQPQPAAVRE